MTKRRTRLSHVQHKFSRTFPWEFQHTHRSLKLTTVSSAEEADLRTVLPPLPTTSNSPIGSPLPDCRDCHRKQPRQKRKGKKNSNMKLPDTTGGLKTRSELMRHRSRETTKDLEDLGRYWFLCNGLKSKMVLFVRVRHSSFIAKSHKKDCVRLTPADINDSS